MEKATLNLNELSTKAQSKNEMYRMLTCDAKIHLLPQKETSMHFIQDIFYSKKKVRKVSFSKSV